MKKVFVFILFISSLHCISKANTESDTIKKKSFADHIFNYSDWFRPFWADMHSTITSGEVSWALNSDEYNYYLKNKELYRPYVFSNLGADLPIWTSGFKNGKYGFGVTLPFFIDVWMDFFERSTAPVINTSYRFGAPEFIFIHRLEKPFWKINNYSLKFTPFKHECTHIGDELTIYRKDENYDITRVNVSYNYAELGITINDPDGSLNKNHAFRFSFMTLVNPSQGWYGIFSSEGDVELVPPSKSPYEWYLQYQYQTNTHKKSHLQGIFSSEVRNRVRYNYPFFYTTDPDNNQYVPLDPELFTAEYRAYSFNGLLGLRYNNPKIMKDYKVGFGMRFYVGSNPYGQFRSLPVFTKFGFTLLFER